jgi:hypothetical protein
MTILALKPLPEHVKEELKNIFNRCSRTEIYEDKKYARVKSYFITDQNDFNYVIKNVVEYYNLIESDVGNTWDYNANAKTSANLDFGINFNVMKNGDWLYPHIDSNPSKIMILLSDNKSFPIHYPDLGITCDYTVPYLLDVTHRHEVLNLDQLATERILMQVFLNKKWSYYVDKIS